MYTSKTYKQKHKTINKTKTEKSVFSPPTIEAVKEYFKKLKSSAAEAEKFFNHYESTGWKINGKTQLVNWEARANMWLARSAEFNRNSQNYLSSEEDKDYTASF